MSRRFSQTGSADQLHARGARIRILITYAPVVHAVQRPCIESWKTATGRSYKRALLTLPSVSAEPLSPAANRDVGSLKAFVTGFPGAAAPTMPPGYQPYMTVASRTSPSPTLFLSLHPSLPCSHALTHVAPGTLLMCGNPRKVLSYYFPVQSRKKIRKRTIRKNSPWVTKVEKTWY